MPPELPPPPPPPMSLGAVAVDSLRRGRDRFLGWWSAATVGSRAGMVGVALAAVFVAAVASARAWAPAGPPPEVLLPRATPAPSASGAVGAAGGAAVAEGPVAVHAAGAVVRPGLYELPAKSRVADLIAAAGGAAGDADVDAVNLAALLADGERIYVPRRGEAGGPGPPSSAAGTAMTAGAAVNLNTATLADLDALPGVGPATAQAIIDYRRQRGRFRSVDELLDVRGIGEARLADLRKRVRV